MKNTLRIFAMRFLPDRLAYLLCRLTGWHPRYYLFVHRYDQECTWKYKWLKSSRRFKTDDCFNMAPHN